MGTDYSNCGIYTTSIIITILHNILLFYLNRLAHARACVCVCVYHSEFINNRLKYCIINIAFYIFSLILLFYESIKKNACRFQFS